MAEASKLPPCVVLCGGPSEEREVSLQTGEAVTKSLRRSGAAVRMSDPPGSLDALTFADGEVAVVALHGRYGEDGGVQQELRRRGVPYTGSHAEAAELTFDKWATRQQCDLRTAAGRLATADSIAEWARYPCVVKPRRGGSSLRLSRVTSAEGLSPAVAKAGGAGEALIEEFVDGEEWTVALLDAEPMAPVSVRHTGLLFDNAAKYRSPSSSFTPLSDRADPRWSSLRRAAEEVARRTGVRGLSRADFLWTGEGDPVFLEINTVPGMTDRSLAPLSAGEVGLSFDDLVAECVLRAVGRGGWRLSPGDRRGLQIEGPQA